MAVDARTEEFQHIEVFDKFALFTNARIDRTIYSEVVNGLRERGYITNNLETRQQVRQRQ